MREHHDLINLALHGLIVGAGENFVRDDLTRGVQGGFEQQRGGTGIVRRAGTAGKRKRRKTFEARGLNEIQRQVIGNDADGHANQNIVGDQNEDHQRGEDSAGSRDGERLQEIFKGQRRGGPRFAQARGGSQVLRSADANAQGKLGGRNFGGHVCKAHRKTAVAFELNLAALTGGQMFADVSMVARGDGSIEIPRKMAFGLAAIHDVLLCERTETRAAAEAAILVPAAGDAIGASVAGAGETGPKVAGCEATARECSRRIDSGCEWTSGSKISLSRRRPRRMRDFTVPTETSRTSATSSYERSSRSRKMTAPRKISGTWASAAR